MEAAVATALDTTERAQIIRLARNCSIEVSMHDPRAIDDCKAHLPAGSDVYISMLPGQTYHATVSFAARLRAAGFNPVPHVAARNLASREAAAEYLARAVGEAGVTQVLVIAGDREHAAGPFESATQLMDSGLFAAHGIRCIGVAGYPEAHPRIPANRIIDTLLRKHELAQRQGLELYVVSQFCFDAAAIEAWVQRISALGCGFPIRIGLAGPASIATLIKYAAICGVRASMRGLSSHSTSLVRMLTEAGPEKIVRRLVRFAGTPEGSAIGGLHFYAFGSALRTVRWARSIANGQFDLPEHDDGFVVGPPG
jgi:methylenetetrahydrofolate reductase (NADPH)